MALSPHAKARIAHADSQDSGDGDKEGGRVMEEFDIDDDEESAGGGQIRQHLFEIEEDDRGDETEEEEEEEEEDDDISRAAAATAFLDNEVDKRKKRTFDITTE